MYLKAGGERCHVYNHNLSLSALRKLCWRLFRIPVAIDWGTSDHADAFVNLQIFFLKRNPTLCDAAFSDESLILTQMEAMLLVVDQEVADELLQQYRAYLKAQRKQKQSLIGTFNDHCKGTGLVHWKYQCRASGVNERSGCSWRCS
jgi:hypothetical protein